MAFRPPYRITKGGWGLCILWLLLAGGAYNAALNVLYLLDSLLVAVFLLALIAPVWMVRGVRGRRSLPRPAFAREPFEITMHVSSARTSRAHFLDVCDPLCAGGPQAEGGLIVRLEPGEQRELSCKAPPLPRGSHRTCGIAVGSRFPFGVAERWRWDEESEELLVLPLRGTLSRALSASLIPTGARTGAPSRTGLPGDEFRTVREYKSGDNPRRIHWHATAHHGALLVRETERERSAPLVVLLDSRLPAGTEPGTAEPLERAIGFAAELMRVAHAAGNQVVLAGFFPEPRVIRVGAVADESQPHRHGAQRAPAHTAFAAGGISEELLPAFEALARLAPSPDSDTGALRSVAHEAGLGRAVRVIAVTPTAETAAGLAPLLAGERAQLFVADSAAFRDTFKPLVAAEGGA